MPSDAEKLTVVTIFLLFNLTILAIAAEHPLRSFAAEWKIGSVKRQTLFDMGGVLGLSLLDILSVVLLAISR